jgi:hypothetical protein
MPRITPGVMEIYATRERETRKIDTGGVRQGGTHKKKNMWTHRRRIAGWERQDLSHSMYQGRG